MELELSSLIATLSFDANLAEPPLLRVLTVVSYEGTTVYRLFHDSWSTDWKSDSTCKNVSKRKGEIISLKPSRIESLKIYRVDLNSANSRHDRKE